MTQPLCCPHHRNSHLIIGTENGRYPFIIAQKSLSYRRCAIEIVIAVYKFRGKAVFLHGAKIAAAPFLNTGVAMWRAAHDGDVAVSILDKMQRSPIRTRFIVCHHRIILLIIGIRIHQYDGLILILQHLRHRFIELNTDKQQAIG